MHAKAKRTGRKASLRTYSFEATVQGRRLEIQRIVPENVWFQGQDPAPELVFLHEGLGSIAHWKKFPAKVAASTGCAALVYSRYGSGNSDLLKGPREVSYMHDEAIKSLPDLLKQLQVEAPILIGHSDGASIALIYAAVHDRVRGLVLLAPHLFVEDLSVKSIAEVKRKFETTNLPAKLSRYHRDAARTFWGWNDIWLNPHFRRWNIEEYLPRISCPILAIQGYEDQYGTMAQVDAIARQSAGLVEIMRLHDCRHSAHLDQPRIVLSAIRRFVDRIRSETCAREIKQG